MVQTPRVKLAIFFHSRSMNIHKLATTAADYAEKYGAEVRLLKVPDLPDTMAPLKDAYKQVQNATKDLEVATPEDLAWADAIMIGSPVHFGLPAPEIVHFIDHSGPVAIPGALMNTVATVFASGSAPHAGAQLTLMGMYSALAHWGCIIAPPGATVRLQGSEHNGAPYGTVSLSRHKVGHVHEDNLKLMEFQTLRTLELTTALKIGMAQTESQIEYITLDELQGMYPDMSLD